MPNIHLPEPFAWLTMEHLQTFRAAVLTEVITQGNGLMLQEILKRMIVHMENLEWSDASSGATAERLATAARFPSCPHCHGVKPTWVYAVTYFPANRIGHADGCQVAKDLDDLRQLTLPVAAVECGNGTLNRLLKDQVAQRNPHDVHVFDRYDQVRNALVCVCGQNLQLHDGETPKRAIERFSGLAFRVTP